MSNQFSFKIDEKVSLSKNTFEGGEIYSNGINVPFYCVNCKNKIESLLELEKGTWSDNLLRNFPFLDRNEILKKGIAANNSKMFKHLGEFSIFPNLPVYYYIFDCIECSIKYMIVYAYGESQPGRDLAYISGVWKLNESI